MTHDELKKILDLHKKYIVGEADGVRADLYGADLSGANLSGAYLSGADLSGANLYGADLYGADLYGADLSGANLYGANLYGAYLSGANLYGADGIFYAEFGKDKAVCYWYGKTLYIKIGCINKTQKEWAKEYKKIGKENNYTKDQITAYGAFIKIALTLPKPEAK